MASRPLSPPPFLSPPGPPLVHRWTLAAACSASAPGRALPGPPEVLARVRARLGADGVVVGGMCVGGDLEAWFRSDHVREGLWAQDKAMRRHMGQAPASTSPGALGGAGEALARWVWYVRATPAREGLAEHARFHARDYVRVVFAGQGGRWTARCEALFYRCPLFDPALAASRMEAVWAAMGQDGGTLAWTERRVESVACAPLPRGCPHWSGLWPRVLMEWWRDVLGPRAPQPGFRLRGELEAQSRGVLSADGSAWVRCDGDPRWIPRHLAAAALPDHPSWAGTDLLGPQAWYVHTLARDAHFRAHQADQYVLWVHSQTLDTGPALGVGQTLAALYAWPGLHRAVHAYTHTGVRRDTHYMPDPAPLHLLDPHTFDRAYLVTCTHQRRPRVLGDLQGQGVILPTAEWLRQRLPHCPAAYLPTVRTYVAGSPAHPHVAWAETYEAPCGFHGTRREGQGGGGYRYVKSTLYLGSGGQKRSQVLLVWVDLHSKIILYRVRARS